VPIALAVAAGSTAASFAEVPTEVALLAYGTRADGRAGWTSTLAAPPPPRSETAEPPRSETPEPEFGRPQPPPTPRKPTFTVGAPGADLGRRR
jgi:hypothetical protein